MTNYNSTRNEQEVVTASRAILNGLAPDGGLYVPQDLEALHLDYHDVISQDYKGMAEIVFSTFFSDYTEDEIQ